MTSMLTAWIQLECLHAGGHRKGKYGPLAGLVPRMGAEALLQLEPGLISMCMEAMDIDAVCKSASSLLAALLDSMWHEKHASFPGENTLLQNACHRCMYASGIPATCLSAGSS